jgi:CRP-like cAMP-binding protein
MAPFRAPGGTIDRSHGMRMAWEAVLATPLATPLPPGLVDELSRVSHRQDAVAGALLLSTRDVASDLVLLAHGDVSLGTSALSSGNGHAVSAAASAATATPAGGFVVERSLSAPAWVDLASAWRGGHHSHDVQANSDAVLLRVSKDALAKLMVEYPDLAPRLMRTLALQIDVLQGMARDLLHKDAEARFASWLLQQAGDLPADTRETVVTLAERKRDIAAQLGVTPETLSRLQRALTRKGLIEVMGYSVRLVDLARLREAAR